MKRLSLVLLFILSASPVMAQTVTRICTQTIGANGSNNCTDVSATNAFPVQGISGGIPAPVTIMQGGAVISSGNPIFTQISQIGGVSMSTGVVATSTAPVTATNTALVVDLRPDSPGIVALGQATKANSISVTTASDQDPCSYAKKSSAVINISSATTTSIVPVSSTTSVYVCGFDFTISEVVTTANTLYFEYGTSTACTGTTALTGLYGAGGVIAGAPIHILSAGASSTVFTAPSANGICAVTAIGGSGSFQGVLTYVQQ